MWAVRGKSRGRTDSIKPYSIIPAFLSGKKQTQVTVVSADGKFGIEPRMTAHDECSQVVRQIGKRQLPQSALPHVRAWTRLCMPPNAQGVEPSSGKYWQQGRISNRGMDQQLAPFTVREPGPAPKACLAWFRPRPGHRCEWPFRSRGDFLCILSWPAHSSGSASSSPHGLWLARCLPAPGRETWSD
ncbi:hypothetical protein N657DRAFT_97810 [Parathielavia appendiculata]|uniref:Uncharacterized protein n=1 Tax=Parathielavia appendiculata TaxID=2587402 RepID=A0AAN6TXT0_9PEZI|nr:hypothetical protein N657DRAFT_97810 [Parathielavia appendiculata]